MPEGTDRGASARRPSARDAGEALLRVAHRLESLLAELAAEHGLTALEARTLRALLDGPSQGGLARQLGRAPSGVSVLTRRLEERGLVSRVSSRSDKRVRTARPTEAGLRVIRAIGAGLAERSPLSTRLTDPEVEALYRLLDALDRAPPS
ncbi:MarR family winged helix-turn-helix transcriptional regulator [Nocardiopsis composta]|uniref:DNA-binding MarR family transcriptional regulator n=1 Tax=Nocardiopsis composta TaxID=157465 RepID=A0A7W8QQK6_9ACTN|nr:MarR family transcriptional regulator [Nocardiopsis composta]MBB5434767.1 DNA-binding MarR family transcriptional regulator [Nocardiopsis composta]